MEVSGVGGTNGAGRVDVGRVDAGRVDVVVPLKRLDGAKSRLRPASAARGATHRGLVLALAHDTLAAVRASILVRRVLLVTGEPDLDLAVDAADGPALETLADPGGGLNEALSAGAARLAATGGAPAATAALQADLPALAPGELDDALRAALARFGHGGPHAAFVADRQGTGTTLLVAAPGAVLRPRFGPGSAAAHRAVGAVALGGDWPGLRADVDTPADLDRVRARGCGPATRAWPWALASCTPTAR